MTDVDDRLREAHAQIAPPDAATLVRVRTRLEEEFARPTRPRWLLAAVAPAAAALAAAVLALAPGRVETPPTPPVAFAARACLTRTAAPHTCLRALADVAGAQRALAAGRLFYRRDAYVSVTGYFDARGRHVVGPAGAAFALTRVTTEELWLAPDGSGRVALGEEGPAHPAGPGDERAWRAAGAPDPEALMAVSDSFRPRVQTFGPGELDENLLSNSNLTAVLPRRDPLSVVPHEPVALAAFLHRAAQRQRPGGPPSLVSDTFGTDVTTFLRYPRTPSDLRAALLDVLATVPGARLLGRVRDPAGRTAAGIRLPAHVNDGENVVAFDPRSARLLAQGRSDGADGVRWHAVYALAAGAVDRVGERPAGVPSAPRP